jgi:hypothetical protein
MTLSGSRDMRVLNLSFLKVSTYIVLLPELVFAVCKVAFATDMTVFSLDEMLAELSLKEVVQLRQLLLRLSLSGSALSRCGGLLRVLSLLGNDLLG